MAKLLLQLRAKVFVYLALLLHFILHLLLNVPLFNYSFPLPVERYFNEELDTASLQLFLSPCSSFLMLWLLQLPSSLPLTVWLGCRFLSFTSCSAFKVQSAFISSSFTNGGIGGLCLKVDTFPPYCIVMFSACLPLVFGEFLSYPLKGGTYRLLLPSSLHVCDFLCPFGRPWANKNFSFFRSDYTLQGAQV